MFKKGDYVIYPHNGICQITDIVTSNMSGENIDYYLLIPFYEQTSKIYIPVATAHQRIRLAMNEKQAREFIKSIASINNTCIEDKKEREKNCKEALISCDPEELVSILKDLYLRKVACINAGRRNTAADDRYYKLIEHSLHSELAFALQVDESEIVGIITRSVEEGIKI